ncbi:FRG domain-containing protein [Emticicia agri]|uniref:FRG domain-containing protein n=1 Tax=Emticicia agri TaxID=2492393 RepID=A0A4Q5LYC2_9BACT|nr:FRG domain-containing protein [Emticicia agri]RYU94645.1 FRG domain-containing protein [Emticicia agri]
MTIENKKTFLLFLEEFADTRNTKIYRGVSSNKYKLIPSIGRDKYKTNDRYLTEKDEDLIFRYFKQRAQPYLSKNYDDMNLLAIAQHHGLPTRLLDWTFNPLAATYFAVEKEIIQPNDPSKRIEHSLIYIYNKSFNAFINKSFKTIKVDKVEFFIPNFNDDRIINQNGLFTIHPYPWIEEYNSPDLSTVIIDLSYRRELRKLLNRMGVNQATIYPGLDGIAGHIKWMETNYY